MWRVQDLFDLAQTEHMDVFANAEFPWDGLKRISSYLEARLRPGNHGQCLGHGFIGDRVFIGEGTVIEDGAMIKGPAIIGKNSQIRHNAYIREYVLIGDGCVVGNACELKNTLLFNGCQVPHFNYVGDSILGHRAHLGAGVKISNFKLVPGNIIVESEGQSYDTGLRKFGALIGDHGEVGCNAVLNPGSIIGRGSIVYPNLAWRGSLLPYHIAKLRQTTEIIPRRLPGKTGSTSEA